MAVVWKISIINLDSKAILDGVVLKKAPFTYSGRISSLRNLMKVIRSYYIPRFSGEKIQVIAGDLRIETTTDVNGSFREIIGQRLSGEVKVFAGTEPLEILQDYPIFFEPTKSAVDVISDIDDTIMVSHTARDLKRIGTLAFKGPLRRKAIPFTQKLLGKLSEMDARIIYVSKSESNLFSMIAAIIRHHNLPRGALILTPYLKLRQLFSYDKGKDYKLNHIRLIMEHSAAKKFVLLGDDSQRDMEVYAQIAEAFPHRVFRIYVRQTARLKNQKHKDTWEKIQSTGISARYFESNDKVDDELELYKQFK
jgi:phosphatidate phosphatase APP1